MWFHQGGVWLSYVFRASVTGPLAQCELDFSSSNVGNRSDVLPQPQAHTQPPGFHIHIRFSYCLTYLGFIKPASHTVPETLSTERCFFFQLMVSLHHPASARHILLPL